MKNYSSTLTRLLVFLCLFSSYVSFAQIDRIEPPNWWVGMNNTALQLMITGENISDAKVSISNPNIKLEKVHKADSPDYLFVDLDISADTKAGSFEIVLEGSNRWTYSYELWERDAGSADRNGFSNKDVMYLITPDRFANGDTSNDTIAGMREGLNREADYGRHGGDIKGISDHLDYIKEMGFTSIWLNPVLENDQEKWSYHGYATTDYYKVDPRFGTNEEYRALSKKGKDMGIGMIMDIIVNHCGSMHWWMDNPPFEDWINYQDLEYQETNHRKSTLLDPYTAPADRKIMTNGWFVPAMPDLNQRNQFMSTYLIQNSIWWIEYADLYGIRQDTYSYPFREFMTDWTCAIMDEYPNFNIVGEEWVRNPNIISYWQRDKVNQDGYTSCLPSLMDFPMVMTLHEALRDDETWSTGLTKLYEMLGDDHVYAHPEDLVIFPDNHDMSRIYSQVNEDYDLYKMALTYILTMRGTPQIYYGTEILMHNRGTESHGVIRSDFPGGWDGDRVNVFQNQGLDSIAMEAKSWLSNLLQWRKDATVVHQGKLMHYEPRDGVYVYFRYDKADTVMVVLNKNDKEIELDLGRFGDIGVDGDWKKVENGESMKMSGTLLLAPRSSSIFQKI